MSSSWLSPATPCRSHLFNPIADIVVIKDNPLASIEALSSVQMVHRNGEIIWNQSDFKFTRLPQAGPGPGRS